MLKESTSVPYFHLSVFHGVSKEKFTLFCDDFINYFITDSQMRDRFSIKGFWKVMLDAHRFAVIVHCCSLNNTSPIDNLSSGYDEYDIFCRKFMFSENKILSFTAFDTGYADAAEKSQTINLNLLKQHYLSVNFYLEDSRAKQLLDKLATMQPMEFVVTTSQHKIAKSSTAELIKDAVGEIIPQKIPQLMQAHDYRYILIEDVTNKDLYNYIKKQIKNEPENSIAVPQLVFKWNPLTTDSSDWQTENSLLVYKPPAAAKFQPNINLSTIDKENRNQLNQNDKLYNDNQFIMGLGHDLRIPISGIMGVSEALSDTKLSGVQKSHVQDIIASSKQLMRLCNNILEVAELDEGLLEAQQSVFSVRKIVDDSFELILPSAKAKNLSLKVSYQEGIAASFLGHRTLLYRVLINLLSNSVNNTEEGTIGLYVSSQQDFESGSTELTFNITDSGAVITEEQYENIINNLKHGPSATLSQGQVSGLGLYMVSQFLKRMQGSIDIKRDNKSGICISFTVPCRVFSNINLERKVDNKIETDDILQRKDLLEKAKNMKILLVEDDVISQTIANMIFSQFVAQVDVVSNGEDALAMIAKNKYSCIFVDIGLPDISGIDVVIRARKIKKFTDSGCLVIALTAHLSCQREPKLIESGFNYVLRKPITKQDALAACCGLLQSKPATDKISIAKPGLASMESSINVGLSATSKLSGENMVELTTAPTQGAISLADIDNKSSGLENKAAGATTSNADDELICLLLKDLPAEKAAMQMAYDNKQYDVLSDLVHRLHGATCYIPVPDLYKSLQKLDKLMNKQGEKVLIEKEYTQVVREIDDLLAV